jgi:2-polyprenyl-6-methoxyphenol hydroxylase-like FAD-dependent oxidoreductase
MPRILIAGAGQCGLMLALGLQKCGHDVTLLTARTTLEIRQGNVTSTQCMFDQTLTMERVLGLNLWPEPQHLVHGIGVSVPGPDGSRALDWLGSLKAPAASIDQRVKFSAWLELFEERGGKVTVHHATISDLDQLSARHDLTIVAAGKGDLTEIFERDLTRSPYERAMRTLAVAYVHGFGPRPEHPDTKAVRMSLLPGVGELFLIPALTLSGVCDILFFEAVPGGPLDRFVPEMPPAERLEMILALMREFTPWEAERAGQVDLTDQGATLLGSYAPVVCQPVAELPSGRLVLGAGDVVVRADPITGQGANNAARCADAYLAEIEAAGDGPFDEKFMVRAFARYWGAVSTCTQWTNAMLAPPPPHVLDIIGAAQSHPQVAARFAAGFNDPTTLAPWFLDPAGARDYLAQLPNPVGA